MQREFERIVRQQIQKLAGNAQILNVEQLEAESENFTAIGTFKDQIQSGRRSAVPTIPDADVPGVVPTISQQVGNGRLGNGFIPNGRLYNNHI